MTKEQPISYKRHRYPAEVISQCGWLYFRFTLSFRDVEIMMADRGVVVSYESIRSWCEKFGRQYARKIGVDLFSLPKLTVGKLALVYF